MRLQVHLTLFSGKPGGLTSPWYLHRVWLNSSDRVVEDQVRWSQLSTRPGRAASWRSDKHFVDIGTADQHAERLALAGGCRQVARGAKISGGKKYPFQPASHLRPTMLVPVLEDVEVVEDEIESVEHEPYCAFVYDLDIDHLHNYVAGGMVVHNCVYGFRGAEPSLLQEFPRDYPDAHVFVLDENHRSTATIVALANVFAAPLARGPACWTANPSGPGARLYPAVDEDDEASFVGKEVRRLLQTGEISNAGQTAVLFRTNAQGPSPGRRSARPGYPRSRSRRRRPVCQW